MLLINVKASMTKLSLKQQIDYSNDNASIMKSETYPAVHVQYARSMSPFG